MPPSTWGAPTRPLSLSSNPVFNLEGCRRNRCQSDEKGSAARRRPRVAREAYSLYVERATAGANAADGPLSSLRLEALREALLFDRMLAVGWADFHARLAGREDLPRVAEPARIERLLHAVHAGEIGLGEDERHVVDLLQPDAVLAGDGAAHLGADLQDLPARRDDARLLAWLPGVVEDIRVEIAVARVEDVADAEPMALDDLVHAAEHVGQLGARDDAVHHHVGGRYAAVGAEGRLAALPQELALRLVLRGPHLARARVAAGLDHALGLRLHAGGEPVQLDQE